MIAHPRIDAAKSETVRRGLGIDAASGSVAAWAHMASGGVAMETILRVLTTPNRRADDPPFSASARSS